jgi:SNF2 family DNA or RNA helicase
MAKAICSVPATSRWAVTGTPIQNRLADLASLLKFLQVHPYNNTKRFEADITHLWKSGEADRAVERLKKLSGYLILRRSKSAIDLPPRVDLRCPVDFTTEERALYDKIKCQTIAHFTEAAIEEVDTFSSLKFVNVIQQINLLRMVCNLGLHYHSGRNRKPSERNSPGVVCWANVAQQAFKFQCEVMSIACQLCESYLDTTERLLGGPGSHVNPLFSQCLRFLCSDCVQRSQGVSKPISCGHSPPHSIAPVSLNSAIQEEDIITTHFPVGREVTLSRLPSKVTSLLNQLKGQLPDVKRSVAQKVGTSRFTLGPY